MGLPWLPTGQFNLDTSYGNGYVDRSAIASISPDGRTSQILWQSTDTPLATLLANGINAAQFGDSESKVTAMFNHLLGKPTATMMLTIPGNCGIDASDRWGEITVFFSHRRFVGYRALGSMARYPSGGEVYFGGSAVRFRPNSGSASVTPSPWRKIFTDLLTERP